MVPKGNPYHISKNKEVMLTKTKLIEEKEQSDLLEKEVLKVASSAKDYPIPAPTYAMN